MAVSPLVGPGSVLGPTPFKGSLHPLTLSTQKPLEKRKKETEGLYFWQMTWKSGFLKGGGGGGGGVASWSSGSMLSRASCF